MSWDTANLDLRTFLSDGDKDKLAFRKQVLGELDSVNVVFKTFEFRRVTDFTQSSSPLGVYLNGVLLGSVASDDTDTGIFVLNQAPGVSDRLEAAYYYQWFLDAEINDFILKASNWLGILDPKTIPFGLQSAALHFGAQSAYLKQAMRWRLNSSATYRMEDAPDPKQKGLTDEYTRLAEFMNKKAHSLRDDFYTRQGQSLQPLTGYSLGRVFDPTPRG